EYALHSCAWQIGRCRGCQRMRFGCLGTGLDERDDLIEGHHFVEFVFFIAGQRSCPVLLQQRPDMFLSIFREAKCGNLLTWWAIRKECDYLFNWAGKYALAHGNPS